ncbi:HAMP domain-containing histidine kinase [Crocinitomicaceae bacterium]|nr:HAMP domain-containing histidine kinase [Crocinitomicaceae bacterium]
MSKKGIHISKQRWKILLSFMVLIVIGGTIIVSNGFISKIGQREKDKAEQWAESVKKKGELVELSNQIFLELKKKEKQKIDIVVKAQQTILAKSDLGQNQDIQFSYSIIESNIDIPVVLVMGNEVSQYRNMNSFFHEGLTQKQKDSICLFKSKEWKENNQSYKIEYYEDMYLDFIYGNSFELNRLQRESMRLIDAFNKEIRENKGLIPVILWDEKTNKVVASNVSGNERKLAGLKNEWKTKNSPIEFDFGSGKKTLYYSENRELTYLQWVPYFQFMVLGLIILLGYFIFSTFRKAEQKRVWAGMAKETAHQLGTPLSSLMGWQAHLEGLKIDPMITGEMKKDLYRLERITDRFSKIGSEAKLNDIDIINSIEQNLIYLKARLSKKVEINFNSSIDPSIPIPHNQSLIDWVVENLCKNSVDAMSGGGKLSIAVSQEKQSIYIDITDTGKGIAINDQKAIFEPGYSTKKRGWGLGLALVKRIVCEHHKGKVFVLKSKIDFGTTIRISLPIGHH